MTQKLLTREELCDSLKIKKSQLYQLMLEGLPVVNIGVGLHRGTPRFCYEDCVSWLKRRQDPSKSTRKKLLKERLGGSK
jgi:hypothetical protein